jgi:two-component system response regulator MprA
VPDATILVVDDDAPIRRMLERTLGSEGYQVDSSPDGGAALAAMPILLLTARDAIPDRVAGLDAGADDYLVKPFAPEELLARVRALLRRGEPEELLAHGDLVFDVHGRSASRGGRELGLSGREADLLELLLQNRRRVVTRELALERIWGGTAAASLNAVDRYVSYLRAKLGPPPLIQTVRGIGFTLV